MSAVELFSTRLLPLQRRQLFWRELVAETFPGMVAVVPEGFRATLARWTLGRVGLTHALSERAHVSRVGTIGQERNLIFHFQRRGALTLVHDDNITIAGCGDVVIVDDTRPYAIDISERNDCLILQVPASMLGGEFAANGWHGQLLHSTDPHVAILRRMIDGLWCERDMLEHVDPEIDNVVAALARIACIHDASRTGARDDGHSPVEYALRNLGDPGLGTAAISAAAGVSPRAVQKAFARHAGLTPTAFITERRLARAADLLRRADGRSITEVAYDVGFSDSAFFSRCFRRRFGMAPREWRSSAN